MRKTRVWGCACEKRKRALPDNALSGETLLIAPLLRPHNASQLAYLPAARSPTPY